MESRQVVSGVNRRYVAPAVVAVVLGAVLVWTFQDGVTAVRRHEAAGLPGLFGELPVFLWLWNAALVGLAAALSYLRFGLAVCVLADATLLFAYHYPASKDELIVGSPLAEALVIAPTVGGVLGSVGFLVGRGARRALASEGSEDG